MHVKGRQSYLLLNHSTTDIQADIMTACGRLVDRSSYSRLVHVKGKAVPGTGLVRT